MKIIKKFNSTSLKFSEKKNLTQLKKSKFLFSTHNIHKSYIFLVL